MKAGQQNPALKRTCVDALWTMRDPAAFEFLGKIVLEKNESIDLRTHALFPLARSMDNEAFPYIKKAYAEAVKANNPQMISSCLAAMGDIHPDLSFDILCDAMTIYWPVRNDKNMSAIQKAYGTAFLQLHYKSGYANVMKQLNDDKAMLKKGMEVYWSDKQRLLNAWDRVRDARFLKIDPKKENVAWRELAKTVNTLSLPARRKGLQLCEFYWKAMTSLDGNLKITKKAKENTLLIVIDGNKTAEQKDELDKK